MSDYDRVMQQLTYLTTGGSNITYIREGIAALEAERALADDLAATLTRLIPADGVLGPSIADVMDRYRKARA